MNDVCCDNVCGMAADNTLEEDSLHLTYEFVNEEGESSSTADLSGEWLTKSQPDKLKFIKNDCLARIEDVRKTNETAKSYSAFLSIPATIDYFAKLAFAQNTTLGTCGKAGEEKKRYIAFCDKFFLNRSLSVDQPSELSRVLYAVRCGLIHGASLKCTPSQTISRQEKQAGKERQCSIHISITQNKEEGESLKDINDKLAEKWDDVNALVEFSLHSGTLCDALKDAVKAMCNDTDEEVSSSIVTAFEEEPPILCTRLEED